MSDTAEADATSDRARLIIVIAYPDGRLDNPWFRAYKRAKRGIRTKAITASVELRPVNDIPAEAGIVIVPEGLASAGGLPAGHVVSSAQRLQADLDAIVDRLLADGRLAIAPPASRSVAVHRGFQPLDGRALPRA